MSENVAREIKTVSRLAPVLVFAVMLIVSSNSSSGRRLSAERALNRAIASNHVDTDELQAFVKAEVVRWGKVVQEAGLAALGTDQPARSRAAGLQTG